MVVVTFILLMISLYFGGGMILDLQTVRSGKKWFECLERGLLGAGALFVIVVLWCPIRWVQLLFSLLGMLSLSLGPVLYDVLLAVIQNNRE